jgi:hypothetical protein
MSRRALLRVTIALLVCAWATAMPMTERGDAEDGYFTYNAKGHRDPFEPLVRDGRIVGVVHQRRFVSTSKPVLHAILWDPMGTSFAIINNEEVRVGDVIESYRVVDIRQDAVVLKEGEEPLVLQITFDAPSSRRSSSAKEEGGASP